MLGASNPVNDNGLAEGWAHGPSGCIWCPVGANDGCLNTGAHLYWNGMRARTTTT